MHGFPMLLKKFIIVCTYVCVNIIWGGNVCHGVCVPEDNFMELVLSFHHYMVSKDQTQIARYV